MLWRVCAVKKKRKKRESKKKEILMEGKSERTHKRRMLLPFVLLFLPVLVVAQEPSRSMKTLDQERMLRGVDGANDALDWIGKSFLDIIDAFLPVSKSHGAEGTDINMYLRSNAGSRRHFTPFCMFVC